MTTTVLTPSAKPIEVGPSRLSLYHWVTTVDHKDIGILYLVTTLVFFVVGGLEALLLRIQLTVPNARILSPEAYNAVFTMHGTTMIFLVIMPMLLGVANYLVPLQIGARDMALPRLNALSFWLFVLGGLVLNFSFLAGTPPREGWFAYAPLTEKPYTQQPSVDYWILGLLITSFGTIATGINLIVTVAQLRAPGMTASRIPVFTWMSLVNGFLIIWSIPSLTAAQAMLLLDRYTGTRFFNVSAGGDSILWQHLFWFFGHPEVYIMVLPAFGMISEITPVFSRKPLFGYPVVVMSGVAIAFLAFGVWAHHMFTVGLGLAADAAFGAMSMLIAIPTGIKIFNWIGTMWGGHIRLRTPMLFVIGFLAMFTIGGITGVQFAMVPIDWQTTDTYYVVAHFHYVLFGGTYFAMSAGAYYWFPKITGRLLSEKLGRWHFGLTLIGFNLTFFPMHWLGLMGMPRRVYTYPDLPGWGFINQVETVGAFILAASVLVFFWNIWDCLRRGAQAGDNPWNGWTLEWATTSPPPAHNFVALPPITSHRPLWDLQHNQQVPWQASGVGAKPRVAQAGNFLLGLSTPVLGTLTFITSEVVFFSTLIVAFIEFRAAPTNGLPGASSVDVARTFLFSLALFASSGTLIMGERRLRRGDSGGFQRWLLATIGLGLIFLAGQITEYRKFIAEGITMSTNPWSGAFYTLTGFHGLHVLVGLLMLSILALLALKAKEFRGGRHHAAVEAVGLYWHFVDGVWVVIFSLVYLGSLL